jgi:hypothetical protein
LTILPFVHESVCHSITELPFQLLFNCQKHFSINLLLYIMMLNEVHWKIYYKINHFSRTRFSWFTKKMLVYESLMVDEVYTFWRPQKLQKLNPQQKLVISQYFCFWLQHAEGNVICFECILAETSQFNLCNAEQDHLTLTFPNTHGSCQMAIWLPKSEFCVMTTNHHTLICNRNDR